MPVDKATKRGTVPTLFEPPQDPATLPIGLVRQVDSSVCFLLSLRPPEATSHPVEGGVNQFMRSAKEDDEYARA